MTTDSPQQITAGTASVDLATSGQSAA